MASRIVTSAAIPHAPAAAAADPAELYRWVAAILHAMAAAVGPAQTVSFVAWAVAPS